MRMMTMSHLISLQEVRFLSRPSFPLHLLIIKPNDKILFVFIFGKKIILIIKKSFFKTTVDKPISQDNKRLLKEMSYDVP